MTSREQLRSVRRLTVTCIATALFSVAPGHVLAQPASANRPDLPSRARGAAQVVLATVIGVESRMAVNEFGDQLIISRATLSVDENWKGPSILTLDIDVEGGTVGGLTLEVSDMPSLEPGQQGVFFIRRTGAGANVPHLRGQGILEIDERGFVAEEGLSVAQIRAAVTGGGRP